MLTTTISQTGIPRPREAHPSPRALQLWVSGSPLSPPMGVGVEEVGAGSGTVPKALRGAAAFAHRKSEAPGAFQARDEGRSQRPGQGQSQLLRRQSSPALSREVSTASLPWALHPKGRATASSSPGAR